MILLKPSAIITMTNKGILKDSYLGIESNKIVYIGKKKLPEAEEILELPKRIILPGFINSHTHVAMTLLRGLKDDADLHVWLTEYILPAEKLLKPSDVYYGALYGIGEMLSHGITTFLDMYYHELEIAKAALSAGSRAEVSYGSADKFFDRSPEEEFKIAEKFRHELESLEKQQNAENKLFFAYGPHSPYGCSRELLELIRDAAIQNNKRIHIHLSETIQEVKQIKKDTGKTPIKYLNSIGLLSKKLMAAHVVWPTNDEIELLAKREVNILHNPTSNLKLGSGIAPIPKMLRMSINVALATDGPASNNRLDIWKEMQIASLIHKGISRDPTVIPAKQALEMATINGAKALGLEKHLGSIDIDKWADFVVVDLRAIPETTPHHDLYSMLVYSMDSRCIESVWVNGETVYRRDLGPTNIDMNSLKDKIENIRSRLIAEVSHPKNTDEK